MTEKLPPGVAFREQPLNKRQSLRQRITDAHPGRAPVIVSSPDGSLPLDKWKYLAPHTHRMAMLYYEIQKHSLKLGASDGLYYMISDPYHKCISVPGSLTVGEVYAAYKDVDGFLYVMVMRENTFG